MAFDNPTDPEEEAPDWLKKLQPGSLNDDSDESVSSVEDEQPFEDVNALKESSGENGDEETPAWLKNIREKEGTDELSTPDSAPLEDNTDWLETIRSQEESKLSQKTKDKDETEKNFLNRIQTLKEDSPQEEAEEINWVAGLEYADSQQSPSTEPFKHEREEDISLAGVDPTDSDTIEKANEQFLSNLTSSQTDELIEAPKEEITPEEISPFTEIDKQSEEITIKSSTLPNWLGDLQEKSPEVDVPIEQQAAIEEVSIGTTPFAEIDEQSDEITIKSPTLPSWLVNLQENSPEVEVPIEQKDAIEEESIDATPFDQIDDEDASLLIESIDMPDWLSEISPSDDYNIEDTVPLQEVSLQSQQAQEILPSPDSDSLEEEVLPSPDINSLEEEVSDELPTWLNTSTPDEISEGDNEFINEIVTEGQEETYGPLMGLRNLLPAEPDIIHFGSPTVPIINLDVSDSHVNKAKLLYQLATSEDQSVVVKKWNISLPNPILRIAIAILLYLSVFIPTLVDERSVALPNPEHTPIEIIDTAHEILNLPDNSYVLIGIEYQPGFSGELEATSASIIDYLNLKGSRIITISTNPTGPGLAKRFFNQLEIPYTSLGYISGGTAALNNFTHFPQDTIASRIGEQTDFLRDIQTINNFDMVVVITDDADNGRAWIEQVQPELAKEQTPMLMIVSAQAEPLIAPYYFNEPKQIAGLTSGLNGGAYYEQYTHRENIARSYWDSFSSGLSISILIIGTSGIYNIVLGIKKRSNKERN